MEYVTILSWSIDLIPTGGVSREKVLKCLKSLQLREANQAACCHLLRGGMWAFSWGKGAPNLVEEGACGGSHCSLVVVATVPTVGG